MPAAEWSDESSNGDRRSLSLSSGYELSLSSGHDSDSADREQEPRVGWRASLCALPRPTPLKCVLPLTVIGFLLGVYVEGWEPICTVYVFAQVVTTVGYGDITVDHPFMKEFMVVYVLTCLVFFSYVINIGAQEIMDVQCAHFTSFLRRMEDSHLPHLEDRVRRSIQEDADHVRTQRLPSNSIVDSIELHRDKTLVEVRLATYHRALSMTALFVLFVMFGTFFYGIYEACSCSYGATFVEGCVEDSLEECQETGGYTKSLMEALYMSVITLTTVGFGDHTPRTKLGRIVGVFWMVFGVTCTVMWLEALTKLFFELETSRHFDHSPVIDEKIFEKMDGCNKGYLTKADFRSYMLVHHKLVAESLIDEIDVHFARLTNGDIDGRITLDDIRLMRLNHKERLKASMKDSRSLEAHLHSSYSLY